MTAASFVSYDLAVAQALNNKTAAALVAKLEYWFSKYKHGFYKFMEPCPHRLYKNGDSWTEEFQVTRKTLTKAFDLIGVRYKSKRLFEQEKDPFQGKLFASYVDNDTNQTFYRRNPAFTQIFNALKGAPQTLQHQRQEGKKSRCAPGKIPDPYKEQDLTNKRLYPPKSPLSPPEKGKGENLSLAFQKKRVQREGSSHRAASSQKVSRKKDGQDRGVQAEKALEIWRHETQGQVRVPPLSPHFATKIVTAFRTHFDACFEKWRQFCRLCATSPWLMGQGRGSFKPWLVWILKESSIARIRARSYGVRPEEVLAPPPPLCAQTLADEIEATAPGREKALRLALLERAGPEAYHQSFKRMTVTVLRDGRSFLKFAPGGVEALSVFHKALLLDLFSSTSFEHVPAGVSLEAHLKKWSLTPAHHYPYLFMTG